MKKRQALAGAGASRIERNGTERMNYSLTLAARQVPQRFTCHVCKRQRAGTALGIPVPVPAGVPRMRVAACGGCAAAWSTSPLFRRETAPVVIDAATRFVRERVARILGLPADVFEGVDGLDGAAAAAGLPRARIEAAILEATGRWAV
jgi:hypothetical protein